MLDIRESIEINTVNVLRALVERVDNIQEHANNVNREMETLRKNQKGNARSQKHHHRMKNTLDELIGRLNTAKERISKLGDRSIEISQTETQRGKSMNGTEHPRIVGHHQKV